MTLTANYLPEEPEPEPWWRNGLHNISQNANTNPSPGDYAPSGSGGIRVWDGTQWVEVLDGQITYDTNIKVYEAGQAHPLTYTTIAPNTQPAVVPWVLENEPIEPAPSDEEIDEALESIRQAAPKPKVVPIKELPRLEQWTRHYTSNPDHTATLRGDGIFCNDCMWHTYG